MLQLISSLFHPMSHRTRNWGRGSPCSHCHLHSSSAPPSFVNPSTSEAQPFCHPTKESFLLPYQLLRNSPFLQRKLCILPLHLNPCNHSNTQVKTHWTSWPLSYLPSLLLSHQNLNCQHAPVLFSPTPANTILYPLSGVNFWWHHLFSLSPLSQFSSLLSQFRLHDPSLSPLPYKHPQHLCLSFPSSFLLSIVEFHHAKWPSLRSWTWRENLPSWGHRLHFNMKLPINIHKRLVILSILTTTMLVFPPWTRTTSYLFS